MVISFRFRIPKISSIDNLEAELNEKNSFRSLININNQLQYYKNEIFVILIKSKYFNAFISAYNSNINKENID